MSQADVTSRQDSVIHALSSSYLYETPISLLTLPLELLISILLRCSAQDIARCMSVRYLLVAIVLVACNWSRHQAE